MSFPMPPPAAVPTNPLAPTAALYETAWRQYQPASNLALLTSQRVHLVSIGLPADITVSFITFVSGSTPLGGGVHQIFGLYDDAFNLLATSADAGAAGWAGTSPKTLAMVTPFVTTYTGRYYLAILVQATTVPTLAGNTQAVNALNNLAPINCRAANTGQTSLPAIVTPGTGTSLPYAYVS